MKILMTGATGLVGKELGKQLNSMGHEIIVFSRSKTKALQSLPFPCQVLEWDLNQGPYPEPLNVDAVFNLMGEAVASRWTDEVKKRIYESRIVGTRNLVKSLSPDIKHFISASAIGFYGDRPGEQLTEASSAEDSFLGGVCKDWENECDLVLEKNRSAQVAKVRIGIVLSSQGGALEKMVFPFKAGVGGALGSGRQVMSWIHLEDLVRLFLFLFDKKVSGVFNGVAPNAVSNKVFSETLAKIVDRPLGLNVPRMAIKLLYGEMSRVILSDQNVLPKAALEAGFEFKWTDHKAALTEVLQAQAGTYEVLVAEQFFDKTPDQIFPFFSDAMNLETITPESLNFKITNISTAAIESGTLIDYKLKIHGVPVKWRTRIEEWTPNQKFVDTQLKGPYQLWHHTHEFIAVRGGTLMRDTVKYKLPVGYLGWLGGVQFVKSDVEKIFNYRRQKVFEIFKSK